MSRSTKFGATGTFPKGRLDKTDEGALTIGIAADHQNQVVRVHFGKPTAWMWMPRAEALQFAEAIIKKATELDG